ncbi:hypothetical protein E4U19_007069 [Claviceps sp. Clav32 group G5]|nr:hypothetical protein E4U19_007069 [Claviceps sp. Clav32 group G5]
MKAFIFAISLLTFGPGALALPEPELEGITEGDFTYTGGDLPRGDGKEEGEGLRWTLPDAVYLLPGAGDEILGQEGSSQRLEEIDNDERWGCGDVFVFKPRALAGADVCIQNILYAGSPGRWDAREERTADVSGAAEEGCHLGVAQRNVEIHKAALNEFIRSAAAIRGFRSDRDWDEYSQGLKERVD